MSIWKPPSRASTSSLERLRPHRAHETFLSQRPAAAVLGNRLSAGLRQTAHLRPRPRRPRAPPPQQSFGQSGASTILGAAVANPVSGRLQRLFGVSKLKIDPQITGGSNTPQATLTLQQQISSEITFTYIQDVTQSNSQIIRIEWAINPQWSAIAARDRNGQFDVDVFYKKRFW